MRKSAFYALTAVVAVFAFVGCSLLVPSDKQEIRIDQTEFSVPSSGGEIEVEFVPVLAWTATCSEDWLTISPESGDASMEKVTMILTVSANIDSKRTADILLSTDAGDVHMTVIQESADSSSIFTQTEFEIPIEGSEIKLKFTPVSDWSIECDADWLSFNPDSGSASTKRKIVTVSVDSNEGGKARTAIVYVIFDKEEAKLTFRQAGEGSDTPSGPDTPQEDPDEAGTEDVKPEEDILIN